MDSSRPFFLRTIREEPKYKEQLEALALSYERLDEILTGVYFTLARHPKIGIQIPSTTLFLIKTDIYPDAPALRIFYTFNDAEVHLLAIEFAGDEDFF